MNSHRYYCHARRRRAARLAGRAQLASGMQPQPQQRARRRSEAVVRSRVRAHRGVLVCGSAVRGGSGRAACMVPRRRIRGLRRTACLLGMLCRATVGFVGRARLLWSVCDACGARPICRTLLVPESIARYSHVGSHRALRPYSEDSISSVCVSGTPRVVPRR